MRLFVLGHYQPRSTLGRSRVGPSVPSTFARKSKPAGDSSRKGSLSDTEPAAHDETPTSGSKAKEPWHPRKRVDVRRREFITFLGGAALAGPLSRAGTSA